MAVILFPILFIIVLLENTIFKDWVEATPGSKFTVLLPTNVLAIGYMYNLQIKFVFCVTKLDYIIGKAINHEQAYTARLYTAEPCHT